MTQYHWNNWSIQYTNRKIKSQFYFCVYECSCMWWLSIEIITEEVAVAAGASFYAAPCRPISVLPVVSNLYIVNFINIWQTMIFCVMLNRAFIKKFSTQTFLQRLTDTFETLNKSQIVGMIALDLQKAFDTVDHGVLLDKVDFYVIKNIYHNWFSS